MGDTDTKNKSSAEAPTLTHSQSINRLREITTELERLDELDHLNNEDERYFQELTEEFGITDEHRKRLERTAQVAKVRAAADGLAAKNLRRESGSGYGRPTDSGRGYDVDSVMEPDSVENCRFKNPWDLSEVRTFGREPEELSTEYRARALSAIEKMPGANDAIRAAATEIVETFNDERSTLSQFVLELSSPTYLRAWSKMAKSPHTYELEPDERRAINSVNAFARSMSLTDSAGGYLVPFQLDPTVIITANGSVNQIRQVARQVVATGDVWNGVSAGAVSWSYDAEGSEVSDDAPTFGQPSIPIYKAQGFVPISIEALQDAANITAEVGRLLAFGKDVLEANSFTVGTGSGMPTGVVTALAANTGSIVESGTTDTFALSDVYKLDGALPGRYRQQPTTAWMANRLTYNKTRQFDTQGGAGLWAFLGEGMPQGILGKRILEAEDMDGSVTANSDNFMMIYGDWSNYVIADRIGTTVEFVPHLFGPNRRPTNQRGWLAYVRHGANLTNPAGMRILNVT